MYRLLTLMLVAVLLPVHTLSAPTLVLPTNDTTPGLVGRPAYCHTITNAHLSMAQCSFAILELPVRANPDYFHRDASGRSPHGPMSLPRTASNGNCAVAVEIAPGVNEDYSSWAEIKIVASEVVRACQHWDPLRTAGGQAWTGDRANIKITVRPAGS